MNWASGLDGVIQTTATINYHEEVLIKVPKLAALRNEFSGGDSLLSVAGKGIYALTKDKVKGWDPSCQEQRSEACRMGSGQSWAAAEFIRLPQPARWKTAECAG